MPRARDAASDLDNLLRLLERRLTSDDFREANAMLKRLTGGAEDDLDPEDFDPTSGRRIRGEEPRAEDRRYAADSSDAFTRMRDLQAAEREVAPIVGPILGMDSASDVFKTALTRLGVSTSGLPGAPALAAAFRIARGSQRNGGSITPATPPKGFEQRHPEAARIRIL